MENNIYKIVFLGESGVGAKTSLINQLVNKKFDENVESTTASCYSYLYIETDLGIINLDLWDTPGQELYREIAKNFILNCHCVILGYDITSYDSFKQIKEYHYNNVKKILRYKPLIYLVANKIDRIGEEKVSEKEAIEYAKEKDIKYFRISARTGEGINELLENIVNSLINKYMDNKINIKEKIEIILKKYYNY